jgi:hypothetical protein
LFSLLAFACLFSLLAFACLFSLLAFACLFHCNQLRRWDTHRTLNPWLLLFKPKIASSIVLSLLTIALDGGDLPKWPLANV